MFLVGELSKFPLLSESCAKRALSARGDPAPCGPRGPRAPGVAAENLAPRSDPPESQRPGSWLHKRLRPSTCPRLPAPPAQREFPRLVPALACYPEQTELPRPESPGSGLAIAARSRPWKKGFGLGGGGLLVPLSLGRAFLVLCT